jgi:ribonuclease BN (tRNA processing enzyme)
VDVGPFRVAMARVAHTESSFAFRVGRADAPDTPGLVYSGDCGDAGDVLTLVRPGDAVLSEAFFGAGPRVRDLPHLTAGDAARVAVDGGASTLLLTHVQDETDHAEALRAARDVFPESRLAEPGMRLTIG